MTLLLNAIVFLSLIMQQPVAARPQRVTLPNKLGLTGNTVVGSRTFGNSWSYSWTNQMNPEVPESVPMLWGRFDPAQIPSISGSSAWLMGANEPDLDGQADITAYDYAPLWWAIQQKYSDRLLASPATSQKHPEWMDQFWHAFTSKYGYPPRLDALAVHCYAIDCISFVKGRVQWAKEHGIPEVWVTEFGFYETWEHAGWYGNSTAEIEARKFVAYLETEPMITRYAPFISSMGDPAQRMIDPLWWPNQQEDSSLLVWNDFTKLTKYGTWYAKP